MALTTNLLTETFPVRTKKGAGLVDGIHTDVIITEFTNQLFVIATQLQKIGTCMSIKREESRGNEEYFPVYHVDTLLGVDEPEIQVIGRLLAEKLNVSKPLLFSVALNGKPLPSTAIGIVDLVVNILK